VSITQLHAARVAEILARPPRPCALCGVPLTEVARPDDTFGPVGPDGRAHGPDPDLAHLSDPSGNWLGASSAYQYLARLDAALSQADPLSKRTETTWLYERTIREYSALKVRLDMGMSFHYHRLASDFDAAAFAASWVPGPQPRSARVPYHCGQPALLRPSGWYCRADGAVLTDESAELAAV
jgi:hypothetical protein